MEEELRTFLSRYIGRGTTKSDIVDQYAVDNLVSVAVFDGIERDIIDYGTNHPDAPFWDFLEFIKPGLGDCTQEELLEDDDD